MRFSVLLLSLGCASLAAAQSDTTTRTRDSSSVRPLAAVKVVGRLDDLTGIASTASQGRVGAIDLRLRPLMREGELLETVPGLIVTQHSGDGKSNQMFVRGFNLDHGTDFQTNLEGMPVNNPSHAHGQGYTDLNFLIPELVDFIDYRLGVQHAAMGDFGSAGGAEFHLVKSLDRPFAVVDAGRFGYTRLATGISQRVGAGSLLLGAEGKGYDGPWTVDQRLRKASALVRYSGGSPQRQWSLLALGYHNRWNASDQVPARAVAAGLSRFGQIDPTLGGSTGRYSLSGSFHRVGRASTQTVQLFGIRSNLDLYSNFTYLLGDPADGDQFNQRETRTVLGVNASHRQPLQMFGREHTIMVGVQQRADVLDDVGLHRTLGRRRLGTIRQDDVTQVSVGVFMEAESRWADRLRSVVGLRADGYAFDVRSNNAANSGAVRDGIVSPKASLIYAPARGLELYLGAGFGFHSNDARGTTIAVDPVTGDAADRVDPLVRSRGAEFGLRASTSHGWRSTVSVWTLDLDSELLFVGDGGATEPTGASRRAGVTFANFFRPQPNLALDADVSFARARFTSAPVNAKFIPGALENVVAAGITWGGVRPGPFSAVRLRHFGSFPLIEDNSVRATASTLINGDVGYQLRDVRLQLTVLNLFNARARDIQYYYASRLAGEPAEGVNDVHFHPAEPRQLRVGIRWER